MVTSSTRLGIATSYERLANAQQMLASGKQLTKPSDNPPGMTQALSLHNSLDNIEQYNRNVDDAKGFVSTTETALGQASDLMRSARTIALQAANDGAATGARTALANQIDNIIGQLGLLGNVTYGQRYVFGGQQTQKPPYISSGDGSYDYQGGTDATGDANLIVDISPTNNLVINVTGNKVIDPALKALVKLRDDISNNQISTISFDDIPEIDKALDTVLQFRSDFGSRIQRMDQTKSVNQQTGLQFTSLVSDIEDADIPSTVLALKSSELSYQAALQSGSSVFKLSLLDFI
jgi:flagellar hook-associated protein 3 FlgL